MAVEWRKIGGASTVLKTIFLLSTIHLTSSTEYVVGDAPGWTLPSLGPVNYTVWASGHAFHVGDSLLFKYNPDYHNVMMVSKSDYEACVNSSNTSAVLKDGKTLVPLTNAGFKYFICGVDQHCLAGQKLHIKVLAGDSESSLSSPKFGGPIPRSPNEAPFSGSNKPAAFIGFVCFAIVIGAMGTKLNAVL